MTAEQHLMQLWQQHQGAIMRTLLAYEVNATARQDLKQDIFLALYQSASRIHTADNPRAYLFRIMHNVIVDHIACATRHKWQPLDDALQDELIADTNLAADLAAQQQQQRLLTAVRQLSAANRQVMLLAMEDLSAPDIADILQISHGAVRVRLNRAKTELMELMADEK
jgi:RNA polymerase sigma-70 factor (ECF subfamily)